MTGGGNGSGGSKGIPKWRGVPPEAGVAPERGVPRGAGRLPGAGLPREAGRLPDQEGVTLKGTSGQMDRGTPGQMDPWAENPWAPGEGLDGAWTGIPPVEEPDGGDDFYLQHPNFAGEDKDG